LNSFVEFLEEAEMKKGLVVLFLVLASYALRVPWVRAAEEPKPPVTEQKPAEPAEKPLEPGWLSLDSSVGAADKWIALYKSTGEKTLGFSIGVDFDASYQWGSNHPRNPNFMSGRIFDQDYNEVDWNDFHLVLDKPEKDWGVGIHVSGDFGLTGKLLRQGALWGAVLHK